MIVTWVEQRSVLERAEVDSTWKSWRRYNDDQWTETGDHWRSLNSRVATEETHFKAATQPTPAFQWSQEESHTPHSMGLTKTECDHLQEETKAIKHNNNLIPTAVCKLDIHQPHHKPKGSTLFGNICSTHYFIVSCFKSWVCKFGESSYTYKSCWNWTKWVTPLLLVIRSYSTGSLIMRGLNVPATASLPGMFMCKVCIRMAESLYFIIATISDTSLGDSLVNRQLWLIHFYINTFSDTALTLHTCVTGAGPPFNQCLHHSLSDLDQSFVKALITVPSWTKPWMQHPVSCLSCRLLVWMLSETPEQTQGLIFSLPYLWNMQLETLPSLTLQPLLFRRCLLLPISHLWPHSMLLAHRFSAINFYIQHWVGILHQAFIISFQVSEELLI